MGVKEFDITEFGASYLDTRVLLSGVDPDGLDIKTQHIGSLTGNKTFSKASRKFRFGETEDWSSASDTEILSSFIPNPR